MKWSGGGVAEEPNKPKIVITRIMLSCLSRPSHEVWVLGPGGRKGGVFFIFYPDAWRKSLSADMYVQYMYSYVCICMYVQYIGRNVVVHITKSLTNRSM